MADSTNTLTNLEKLAEIKKSNPKATHIYMRRNGKDGAIIDVPIAQAAFTINMWPLWDVVASNKQMDDEVEALFDDDKDVKTDVPPKPSENKKKEKEFNELLGKAKK